MSTLAGIPADGSADPRQAVRDEYYWTMLTLQELEYLESRDGRLLEHLRNRSESLRRELPLEEQGPVMIVRAREEARPRTNRWGWKLLAATLLGIAAVIALALITASIVPTRSNSDPTVPAGAPHSSP